MNIYIGHYISVIETVVISFIFLPFTTEVKMQIKQATGQFMKEKCLENRTQSFPFFLIFFDAPFLFFFYHYNHRLNGWIESVGTKCPKQKSHLDV